MTIRRRAALGQAAFAAALLVAAGCAPKRVAPPPLAPAELRLRYEQSLTRREMAAAYALADVDVRVEGRGLGRLPRFEMRAAIQTPDRLRLRASWLLGTVFDLCAEGDSVRAVVPSRHRGLVVGGGPSPIGPPAERFLCALLALWRPDSLAWSRAVQDSGFTRLTWLDGTDSLRLVLGADAHPEMLVWRSADGPEVRARYAEWQAVDGADLPHRVTLEDDRGAVRARLELAGFEARRASDPEWFSLSLPERTERVDWSALGRWLLRAGDGW